MPTLRRIVTSAWSRCMALFSMCEKGSRPIHPLKCSLFHNYTVLRDIIFLVVWNPIYRAGLTIVLICSSLVFLSQIYSPLKGSCWSTGPFFTYALQIRSNKSNRLSIFSEPKVVEFSGLRNNVKITAVICHILARVHRNVYPTHLQQPTQVLWNEHMGNKVSMVVSIIWQIYAD